MDMQTCLGCWDLKQGTIASGVWTTILGCVVIGIDSFNLWEYTSYLAYYLRGYEVSDHYAPLTAYLGATIVLASLWVIASVLLFFGVCMKNKKHWLLLPWMIITAIISFFYLGDCIMYFTYVSIIWGIVAVCIFLVLVSGNIYSLICVVNYFRLLRKGKDVRKKSPKPHIREKSKKQASTNLGYEDPLSVPSPPEYPKHGFRGQRYHSREASEQETNQIPPPYEEHAEDRI